MPRRPRYTLDPDFTEIEKSRGRARILHFDGRKGEALEMDFGLKKVFRYVNSRVSGVFPIKIRASTRPKKRK